MVLFSLERENILAMEGVCNLCYQAMIVLSGVLEDLLLLFNWENDKLGLSFLNTLLMQVPTPSVTVLNLACDCYCVHFETHFIWVREYES